MPQVNSRWRKQLQFSLGGSKHQNIRGYGSESLARNPFLCLSPLHEKPCEIATKILEGGQYDYQCEFETPIQKGGTWVDGNNTQKRYARPSKDLMSKIDKCDINLATLRKELIKEGGSLFSADRFALLAPDVDEDSRECVDEELHLKMNISYDDEPASRMEHQGVNLVYFKEPNFGNDNEHARQFCPKNGFNDYLLLEEANPWSCTYIVGTLDCMKPETQSPPISSNLDKDQQDSRSICIGLDVEHSLTTASEGIEIHINSEDLYLDKEIMNLRGTISEDDIYDDQITSKHSEAKFWDGRDFEGHIVSKPEEIDKLNRNLALHRLKACELSKEIQLDDKKLKDYNPDTFKERDYFVDYEEDFEWVFHPDYCNLAGLDDYQRLVPKEQQPLEYLNWKNYHQNLSDYASDKEYLEYCKEISKQLQFLTKYLHLHPKSIEWRIMDHKAFTQALKIATGYPSILPNLVFNAYQEYLWSLRLYSEEHDVLHGLYYEVWRLFAKVKKSFKVALKEVYDRNMFPLCNDRLHHELTTSHKRERVIEHKFNTFLAGIHKTAPDSEVHEKIEKAVQNSIQKIKFYEQYAEKKIAIAKSIGLVS